MNELKDKVALITGGTRGIGYSIAKYLANEGASVWTTSRTSAPPAEKGRIEAGQITDAFLELENEESIQALFARIIELHGRLDILVNNAGVGVFKPIVDISLQEWQKIMNINVTGLFLCSREAFKIMQKQGGGRIIHLGSVAGYIPIPENGAYGTTKYAVRGFSHILNEEGKEFHIRSSVINAGIVYTDISKERTTFAPDDMLQPSEVAKTVLDICTRPLNVRIDEINLLPAKGIL